VTIHRTIDTQIRPPNSLWLSHNRRSQINIGYRLRRRVRNCCRF